MSRTKKAVTSPVLSSSTETLKVNRMEHNILMEYYKRLQNKFKVSIVFSNNQFLLDNEKIKVQISGPKENRDYVKSFLYQEIKKMNVEERPQISPYYVTYERKASVYYNNRMEHIYRPKYYIGEGQQQTVQQAVSHSWRVQARTRAYISIRGLPRGISNNDILQFLDQVNIMPLAVYVMLDPDGRQAGLAFAEFSSPEDMNSALALNGHVIQHNSVQIRPISYQQMCDILKSPLLMPPPPPPAALLKILYG